MEKRDYVLSRYPDAVLVEVPPISRGTDSVRLQPGYWVVYSGRDQNAIELGRGESNARAWVEAASRLQQDAVSTDAPTDSVDKKLPEPA